METNVDIKFRLFLIKFGEIIIDWVLQRGFVRHIPMKLEFIIVTHFLLFCLRLVKIFIDLYSNGLPNGTTFIIILLDLYFTIIILQV